MNASRRWGTTFFLLLTAIIPTSGADTQTTPDTKGASNVQSASPALFIEPEIVRITYVDGDVRLAPTDNRGAIGKSWVQAQAGVPVEQGDTIATGIGRAEIELEDESVIYLADNSTMLFEVLDVPNDAPETRVLLVSGTATIDVQPSPAGSFVLESPGNNHITITPPESAFVRVDSYIDGMAIMPQRDTVATHEGADKTQLRAGQRIVYQGLSVHVDDPKPPTEWDTWVQSRVALQQTDMQAALKASGLTEPVPGLVELYKTGSFSSCAPYGTCWRFGDATAAPAALTATQAVGTQQQTPSQSPTAQQLNQPPASKIPKQLMRPFSYELEPCVTVEGYQAWDPKQRKWIELPQYTTTTEQYWNWASCRAGTWVHQGHGFVLVLHREKRHHRHHHPPVCWVRVGGRTGFVPRDPRDKTGKPPINLKYGLFIPSGKPDRPMKLVQIDSSNSVQNLTDPPKGFREIATTLPQTERPTIVARSLPQEESAARPTADATKTKNAKAKITYDYKESRFAGPAAVVPGSREKSTVLARLDFRSMPGWTVWSGTRALSANSILAEWARNATVAGGNARATSGGNSGGAYPGRASISGGGARVGHGGGARATGGGSRGGGSSGGSGGGGGYSDGSGRSSGGGGYGGGGSRGGGSGGGGFSGGGSSGGGGGAGRVK